MPAALLNLLLFSEVPGWPLQLLERLGGYVLCSIFLRTLGRASVCVPVGKMKI